MKGNIKNLTLNQWVAITATGVALFIITAYNTQPWFEQGRMMAGFLTTIPGSQLLFSIGFLRIGDLFRLLFSNGPQVIGLAFWALCQYLQVLPFWMEYTGYETTEKMERLRVAAYVAEIIVCLLHYPPYGNGAADFFADFGRWDVALISGTDIVASLFTILAFEGVIYAAKEILTAKRKGGQRVYR